MSFLKAGGSGRCRVGLVARASLAAWAVFALAATPVHADRIYRIVEYPAFQSSYRLEGTITTTDDAPADSLLATEEILAWEYRATHSAASFPGRLFTSDDTIYVNNTTAAIGVRITDSSIELPLATPEHPERVGLVLGRQGFLARGLFGSKMVWESQLPVPAVAQPYRTERYEGDIGFALWNTDPTGLVGPNWLIATIVPEPVGAMLCTIGSAMVLSLRRRRGDSVP